jgi:anti-sigma B factor antagonist
MEPEIQIIAPQGRLDAAGTQPLEAELKERIAAGATRLIVDFRDTRYIGSNGLRVLLAALKLAQEQGGALKLCGLVARLKEIFVMAGFDRVFEIFETREEAEKSFRG